MTPRAAILLAAIGTAMSSIALLVALPPIPRHAPRPAAPRPFLPLHDAFDRPSLDPRSWTPVSRGSFLERSIDIHDGRLRLRAATSAADDPSPRILGVRSASRLEFRPGTRLAVDLDPGDADVSAALVLAPQAVDGSPLDTPDWLRIEHAGGLRIGLRRDGRELPLFTAPRGAPAAGPRRLELVVDAGAVEIRENDVPVFATSEALPFDAAYLYLLLLRPAPAPPGEILWDNVRVTKAE